MTLEQRGERALRVIPEEGRSHVENPDLLVEAVARQLASNMMELSRPMVDITRLGAATMRNKNGEPVPAFEFSGRGMSMRPENIRKLLKFLTSPLSYRRLLGLNSFLYKPIEKTTKSLQAISRNKVIVVDNDDPKVTKVLKKAYAYGLGVPPELTELAGEIPQVAFYLELALWWGNRAMEADENYRLALEVLKKMEALAGNGAQVAEEMEKIYLDMEGKRKKTHQQIMGNAEKTEKIDIVESLRNSDGGEAAVTEARGLVRTNIDLYRQNNEASLLALDAALNVARQVENVPGNNMALQNQQRLVLNHLKQRFICTGGVDLALSSLHQFLLAGMSDMVMFQNLALRGQVEMQKGQIGEAMAALSQGVEGYANNFIDAPAK